MEIGQSAGKSYAYILGVFLGDGCVTKTQDGYWVFRLNTIDEDFALAVKEALLGLDDRPVNINKHEVKKSSKPNYSLRFGSQELCQKLFDDTEGKMIIPAYVLNWSGELKKAFIVGLMDSEGFVGANQHETGRRYYMGFKSCDKWVPEFMQLLQSVGVRHGKVQTEEPYKPGYKAPTRFTIKMQTWIDSGMRFNIKRKQDRVDEWERTEPYSQRSRHPRKLTSETTRQAGKSG